MFDIGLTQPTIANPKWANYDVDLRCCFKDDSQARFGHSTFCSLIATLCSSDALYKDQLDRHALADDSSKRFSSSQPQMLSQLLGRPVSIFSLLVIVAEHLSELAACFKSWADCKAPTDALLQYVP